MYEESLELLAFCKSLLQAHEARGEDIHVLTHMKHQVAVQRTNLRDSLAAQLRTDIHLPACVRIVGFLRRVQRHSEEELRELFIEHRSKFLDTHKQQVELLRHSRGSVGTALRNAADLLRTHLAGAVARMEQYSREMLDSALLTFHAELGRYDWVPSTALAGGGASAGWLHPQALELTRHRPLAVLTNDIVQAGMCFLVCSDVYNQVDLPNFVVERVVAFVAARVIAAAIGVVVVMVAQRQWQWEC
ncbi:Cog8 [Symbiodinium sp. CCMP2592]|nr:Cog8 [Symbiodinium sp. CCMP2592]